MLAATRMGTIMIYEASTYRCTGNTPPHIHSSAQFVGECIFKEKSYGYIEVVFPTGKRLSKPGGDWLLDSGVAGYILYAEADGRATYVDAFRGIIRTLLIPENLILENANEPNDPRLL